MAANIEGLAIYSPRTAADSREMIGSSLFTGISA